MAGLDGKLALVTGASRGIGRAIAARLARDGATVAVHYAARDAAAAETVAAIEKAGGKAFAVKAPLDGTLAAIDALFARLDEGLKKRGRGNAIDILVNNAAVSLRGLMEKTPEAIYDENFAVNAKSPFFIVQKALPRMPDGGRIINISSQTSLIAFPDVIAYSMSKGALDIFTKVLAKHLGPRNITVNAIQPGVVDTEMNASWLPNNPDALRFASGLSAFNRIAEPEDIADMVGFLASNDARWITGQRLDGGGGSIL
jgi:NAD(P)-dependent dehydrogenase (short-subunit alcohol dehydrogenase family)